MFQNIGINMKSSQHKMTSNLLLILVLIINTSTKNLTAQESQKPNINGLNTPFDFKKTETFCNRDWMASEEVMDSLKRVIIKLDNKIKRLPHDSTIRNTSSLVLLYSYVYIVSNDPWGESIHQWCIDTGKYGTPATYQRKEQGQ